MKNVNRIDTMKTVAIMLAMFFNPFGFDILFKIVLDWTGSFWKTDLIFYSISTLFFLSYLYLNSKSKKIEDRAIG
jgi:hypothetical protein